MNLKQFNKQFKKINEVTTRIDNLLEEIYSEIAISEPKSERNFNLFNKISNQYSETESLIKSKMDNKYNSFQVIEDFSDSSRESNNVNFEINSNIRSLMKKTDLSTLSKTTPSSFTYSSDRTKLIVELQSDKIYNELNYSFYSSDNEPLVCKNIHFELDGIKEELYEMNFRYFSRNVINDFVTKLPFYPRKISKIYFEFYTPVNTENSFVSLLTKEYSIDESDEYIMKFINTNNLSTINVHKVTDESVVPLVFEYSSDNVTFNPIVFSEANESSITLDDAGEELLLKIKSDYDSIMKKEESDEVKYRKISTELPFDGYSYVLSDNADISSFKVSLSYSSYSLFKEKLDKVNIDINEIVEKNDNVYSFKNNFHNIVSGEYTSTDNLIYFDDVRILVDNLNYANFYLDEASNSLFSSAFMFDIPFIVEFTASVSTYEISNKYFTPFVFSVELKG